MSHMKYIQIRGAVEYQYEIMGNFQEQEVTSNIEKKTILKMQFHKLERFDII